MTQHGFHVEHGRAAVDLALAASLAPAMRAICGAADVLTDPLQLRTYECDGLTSHRTVPALVVLPETAEEVAAVVRLCASAGVPCRGARQRHRAVRRRASARFRRADRVVAHAPDPGGRPGGAAGGRRAGGDEPFRDPGGGAARAVLRPGPVVAGGLLGRRERARRTRAARTASSTASRSNHVLGLEIVTPGRRADLAGRRHRRAGRL